jgi:hypothetical protein
MDIPNDFSHFTDLQAVKPYWFFSSTIKLCLLSWPLRFASRNFREKKIFIECSAINAIWYNCHHLYVYVLELFTLRIAHQTAPIIPNILQSLQYYICIKFNCNILSAFIKSRYPVLLPGYGSVWYREKKSKQKKIMWTTIILGMKKLRF